ncbi:SPOSA6832_04250, partial [Sporobolomyces salmonicolor]
MANWLGEDPPPVWVDPHHRTMYRESSSQFPPYPTRNFPPSDQINNVTPPNVFTGMSHEAQIRHGKIQSLLNKTLGPEQIANRPGGGGAKLTYLEGWKAINLANEVFGYNGWFTDIKYLEADFIDYDPDTKRYSMGVTAIVRVRLQDGASHEDVGYGKLENTKSKADGLDKVRRASPSSLLKTARLNAFPRRRQCKKEAVTDGLKRALRHFGKLLGNCLYDKHYLEGLARMKAPKVRPSRLLRSCLPSPELVTLYRNSPSSTSPQFTSRTKTTSPSRTSLSRPIPPPSLSRPLPPQHRCSRLLRRLKSTLSRRMGTRRSTHRPWSEREKEEEQDSLALRQLAQPPEEEVVPPPRTRTRTFANRPPPLPPCLRDLLPDAPPLSPSRSPTRWSARAPPRRSNSH